MKTSVLCLVVGGLWQVAVLSAQGQSGTMPRWEYKVVAKDQLLDLGKKDLGAGLNKLGDEGWELVAVETSYIFKRSRAELGNKFADVQNRVTVAEYNLEVSKDRASWAERMSRKGFLSDNQLKAAREQLRRSEIAVEQARRELGVFLPPPNVSGEKGGKAEK